ncbi:ribonucleoside-diphosphate reductase subunit beta [Pseudomonas phage Noxifer]|uniref:ribonucleoside-diphosphate reductase n=1 Tax=Pseudomonas phage Noxifer TaxID=2006684 RepID=A0A1Y0SVE7_9CAUD|nr:ribonucleoside-diphosphate reductase subunit beta [Pseudomonas phage Noxifer]ARV77502.1 ribonucleoside-diphosphate reductase subunit beta [Pseudomonas phage Noxifer]
MSEIIVPSLDNVIFNQHKGDYGDTRLFLGEPRGLLDTVNDPHPKLWEFWRSLRGLDWDTNEFDFSPCLLEFKTKNPGVAQAMIQNLGWQWEGDSIAANSIMAVGNHFVTNSALKVVWDQIVANENLHATTYSEIVRYSFDSPNDVLNDVLGVKEALARSNVISAVMAKSYRIGLRVSLGDLDRNSEEAYEGAFMFSVALFLLERVNFMGSFAVTGAIAQTGDYMPICKAVQRIAQDEAEIHVNVGKYVIENELKTERGRRCWKANRKVIDDMGMEVRASEMRWRNFQRDSGSIVPHVGWDEIGSYINFNVADALDVLERPVDFTAPLEMPLPYMTKWLDVAATQASPQEQDNGQYRVNVVKHDDNGLVFPFPLRRPRNTLALALPGRAVA